MVAHQAAQELTRLNQASRQRLLAFAASDTATRLAKGSGSYVLMLVILGLSSHAYTEHPGLMKWLTAIICLVVAARILALKHQPAIYGRSPETWHWMSLAGTIAVSTCCGVLYGSFIIFYGYASWTFTIVMVWITGTAAGALITFTANQRLLHAHLILNFLPALLASLYTGGVKGYCYAFAVLLFMVYMYIQGRSLGERYWSQLIAQDLEAQRGVELERARQKAEDASSAKSQFLAHVSHEIRTPMHGVLGIVDLLLNTKPTPQQRQLLEILNSSAESLLHVINDVLDLSKVEAGKLSLESIPVDIRLLAAEIRAIFAPQVVAKNIELLSDIGSEVPEFLVCDPVRLRQVLVNLIGNAVKFTEHGSVALKIKSSVLSDRNRSKVTFSVSDTGIGIPIEKQASIFEAFTQADGTVTRRFGGTGLGLAISGQIVQLMGSEIRVESEPGRGSCFSFTCELQHGYAELEKKTSLRQTATVSCLLRILVADDNPVNRMIVDRCLSEIGHKVTLTANGQEALEAALSSEFDVVLMDHQMPVLGGIEAAKRIKQRKPEIPIIMVSANAMEGDREMFLQAGMDGYVSKPFRLHELLDVIETCTRPQVAA